MEKTTQTKVIALLSTIFLLLIVIGASFAYFGSFTVNLNNNVAVNINAASPGTSTFVSTSATLNLQVPASSMSQTVVEGETSPVLAAESTANMNISLTSGSTDVSVTCSYDVYYEYTGTNVYGATATPKTTGATKEITMQVTASVGGTNNYSTETNFDTGNGKTWSSNKATLITGATITNASTTETTQTLSFTMKFYNFNANQNALAGKPFVGKIYAEKTDCTSTTK